MFACPRAWASAAKDQGEHQNKKKKLRNIMHVTMTGGVRPRRVLQELHSAQVSKADS